MREPKLPNYLEDLAGKDVDGWHAKAMQELARQLGVGNDFYYPLLGVIAVLKAVDKNMKRTK